MPLGTWVQGGFIALFLSILLLPLLDIFLPIAPRAEFSENRTLASRPALVWTRAGIESFPARFGEYFKDRFGFRKNLIQLHTIYKTKLLAQSPNRKVLLGGNGWLYFTGEAETFLQYLKPFSEEELNGLTAAIESSGKWFGEHKILFFILVAPNKQTIYPEFLPEPQAAWTRYNHFDDFLRHFKSHSPLDVFIDIKQSLLREKNEGKRVYYQTDSHWNNLSAFLAYDRILTKLRQYNVQATGKKPGDFEWVTRPYSGDLVNLLGVERLFSEKNDFLVPRYRPMAVIQTIEKGEKFHSVSVTFPVIISEADKAISKKVLFLRDSQLDAAIPLFSESFRRTVYINYGENPDVIKKILEAEKPDIVLCEIVERNLLALPRILPRQD